MMQWVTACVVVVATAAAAFGQTPQPFPRAGLPAQDGPSRPASQAAGAPDPAPAQPPVAVADPDAPSADVVGFPLYPNAQFLGAYDAGKGQRYYLYGSQSAYDELVKYYQNVLRDRGARVFDEPATHTFAQRFREDLMVFPPGVTVKDWTSGGSLGYPHSKIDGQPERFPTVIMIVPPLPESRD